MTMSKFSSIAGALLLLLSAVPASRAAEEECILENRHVRLVFAPAYHYGLKRIDIPATGRSVEFAPPAKGESSLWSMVLLAGGRELPELHGGANAVATRRRPPGAQQLQLVWTLKQPAMLKVTAEITLPDDSGLATWHLKAETAGTPAPWIKSVVFPRLNRIQPLGDDCLVYGEYLGRIVRDPARRMREVAINHPGRWSMQFAAFYGSRTLAANHLVDLADSANINGFYRGPAADESGFFLAADDDNDYHKSLLLNRSKRGVGFLVAPVHYPVFPAWPQERAAAGSRFVYSMPYTMKLGALRGGAGEAARLYRELTRERKFLAGGPLRAPGNHVSPKVLDGAFWAKLYNGANKVVPEAVRLREYLKVPVNLHWCRYNAGRFDDDNLDYLPTMANFREGVRELKAFGVGVAPYVCCAIWDQDTESYRRYGMEKAAARTEFGTPYLWLLAGNQPSAWMHPASPQWQARYRALTGKLFGQWGTDGQYLDVLAAAGKLCYNTDLHRPHGGNYWVTGNRQLLTELRRECRELEERPFLTTESFTENYIDLIDAFLTLDITRYGWKHRRNSDVYPLFSLIYHDYAVPYGSDGGQHLSEEMLRWEMGLSFCWGVQLCYSDAGMLEPDDRRLHDRYTRELARAWYRAGADFLTGGRGIETAQVPSLELAGEAPAALESAPHRVRLSGYLNRNWEGPSVAASCWQSLDGRIGVTMANLTGKAQAVRLRLDPVRLENEFNVLCRVWPLPVEKIGRLTDKPEVFELTVEADRAMILEIRGDDAPAIRPLPETALLPLLADDQGEFPTPVVAGGELYGHEDRPVANENGRLTLLAEPGGPPLKVRKLTDWRKLEGRGGPRHPDDRTFYLLKPTGCRWQGEGRAVVIRQLDGSTVLELEGDGVAVFTPPAGHTVIRRDADGGLEVRTGAFVPAAGRCRLLLFAPGAEFPTPPPGGELSALALMSRRGAELGETLLTGADNLPAAQHRRGERLLALGNAAAFLVSGRRPHLAAEHDWLLPGRPTELRYREAGRGELRLLNRDRQNQFGLEAGGEGRFSITPESVEAAGNLWRLLYRESAEIDGETFVFTALDYLEVAEPLLAEIDPVDAVVLKGSGDGVIRNRIVITNTAPVALPVRLTAELPEGWTLPAAENELEFELPPQGRRRIELVFHCRDTGRNAGRAHPIRVKVHYTADPAFAVSEDFRVIERATALVPAGNDQPATGDATWSNVMRHQGRTAILAGPEKRLELDFRPVKIVRETKELKWTLFDAQMTPLQTGVIRFAGRDEKLQLPVERPGLYFVHYSAAFFRVRIVGAAHYGFSCWEYDRYILNGKERTILYFPVERDATQLVFRGQDGGPLEPARVVIRTPDGKAVYDRSGNYAWEQAWTIPVPPAARGRIWSLEITPVEDFEFGFVAGTAGWVSPSREAVLTEQAKQSPLQRK